MSLSLLKFIEQLKDSPNNGKIFNPWYQVDTDNELGPDGPSIRRQHLNHYLEQRLESARYLLIAEAVGYQGGHFSGVAMTSERILLGHQAEKGILPEHAFVGHTPQRTSRPERMAKGFTEPTATIVWSTLLQAGVRPYDFVLWNAFPWHPYQPQHKNGLLSNRTPTPQEMEYAQPFLQAFLSLFPERPIIAVGQKCATLLETVSIQGHPVRHPANGGATKFRDQTLDFLKKN